jgi:organic radical activating enzyme
VPENEVPISQVVGDAKTKDSPTYAMVEPKALIAMCGSFTPRHVVITGGEPCDHDLHELTAFLSLEGFSCQIETSGTSEIRCAPETWVTLSPKIGMPGGKTVRDDAVDRADEIKIPVGKRSDVDQVNAILLRRADIVSFVFTFVRCEGPAVFHRVGRYMGWADMRPFSDYRKLAFCNSRVRLRSHYAPSAAHSLRSACLSVLGARA